MRKFEWLVLSLMLFVLLVSCASEETGGPSESDLLVEPTMQFGQELRLTGKVVLSEPLDLSFTTAGRLIDLLVEQGDEVSSGDVLARLEPGQLEEAVSMAEANRDLAKLEYDRILMGADPLDLLEAENDLVIAQSTVVLNLAQVAIKEAQISSAQARLDYLKSLPQPEDITIAEAQLRIAQAELDMARARMLETVLIAPTDGIVNLITFKAYDYVAAGRTIMTLGDPTDLSVEVTLDEVEVIRLSIGSTATVRFAAIPGVTVNAIVTDIALNLDTASSDFLVKLKLAEVPSGLRWGMSAEVILTE